MLELLLLCVLVAMAALWILDVPVPREFSRPHRLRWHLAKAKLKQTLASIQERLGLRTRLENRRLGMASMLASLPKPSTEGMDIEDTAFDGVRVRVYKPFGDPRGLPAMVFFHGGGWVRGSIESFHHAAVRLVREVDMVVVTVAYRFAPEHPFPAAFDDCVAATKHFLIHARTHGADPRRVVLSGSSAGGNLAAAVSLRLRNERFEPMPRRQQLIYPCLQVLDLNTPSMIQNQDGPLLTREVMAWYWSMYVSGSDRHKLSFLDSSHTTKAVKETLSTTKLDHRLIDEELRYPPYEKQNGESLPSDGALWAELRDTLTNPYCCPLMADDLSGLPGTLVFNCKYDVLRDDGVLYGRRLEKAGVKVTMHLVQTGFHGIDILPDYPEGEEFFNIIASDVKSHV